MIQEKSKSHIIKKRGKKEKKRSVLRFFFWILIILLVLLICGAIALAILYYYLSEDLPHISSLTDYTPPTVTTVYSDDNRKIAEFFNERRLVIPLEEMPDLLLQAFIAAEDSRFYDHEGIDFVSIIRAFFRNLEAGTIVQGGSTITQQVTKSFLLSPERSYTRKIKEAILARKIDKTFTKDEILFLYLNQIYLGHGAYGVESAAENYFGKHAKELNLAECAILAGLPQAPSKDSPFLHPERAKERQIYVLNRMVKEEFITDIEASEAINMKLDIKPRRNWYIEEVPFYTEYIRQYVERVYGRDILYNKGLKIYSTVNIEMQKAAREEIGKGLYALDKRQGYRGALQNIKAEETTEFINQLQESLKKHPIEKDRIIKGVVTAVDDAQKTVTVRLGKASGIIKLADMDWARKPNPDVRAYKGMVKKPSIVLKAGDVILVRVMEKIVDTDNWQLALEQEPKAESAVMCMETGTGNVKTMVGGFDFKRSQFNRALQSRRQPGSAFKPIIYAAALDRGETPIAGEKGYTPATIIIDSSIVFRDKAHDFTWKPKNYKETYYGPTRMRVALAKSRNVVTIKILEDVGVGYVIDYAKKLGIQSTLSPNLSIALGSSGVSLLELTGAYSVFANQGYFIKPIFITRIEDRNGKVLEEAVREQTKAIGKNTAFVVTSLLEGVVREGTGARVKALKRPVAGKTGTTNNLFDAWFMGFTPDHVTGCWVGLDEESSLGVGENGSKTAIPIWLGFMEKIYKDKPVKVFKVPEGVVFAKIDAKTGLLAIPESEETLVECFKEGTAPTKHTPRPGAITDTESFYKMEM